ncbi:DUF362 domain-containing protein, partial [Candidatus Aerophobetes bacterium]|nr:DUF362 domain-containing protein [Candidatus Aerophobetes bacterium]
MQSKICLLKCENYDEEKVEEVVRESIRLLGGIRSFICPGDRVLLKVNLLSAHPPERAVTTHPALVKAVVRVVKDAGAKPFIGDSCGVAYRKEDAMMVWEKTGIARVAREEKVEIVNFQKAKKVKNPRGKPPFLYIAKEAMEADAVFSLPKLKTHTLTLFTGAIKNMYGTVPGFWKKDLHARFPRPRDFAKVVVDLFSLVFPKLSIMDGILGMEGKGPSAGSPRKI